MEPKIIKEETIEKEVSNYADTQSTNLRTRSNKAGEFYFLIVGDMSENESCDTSHTQYISAGRVAAILVLALSAPHFHFI